MVINCILARMTKNKMAAKMSVKIRKKSGSLGSLGIESWEMCHSLPFNLFNNNLNGGQLQNCSDDQKQDGRKNGCQNQKKIKIFGLLNDRIMGDVSFSSF